MDETKNTGINLLISAFPGLSVQKTVGPPPFKSEKKFERREKNKFDPLENWLQRRYESDSSSDATTTTLGITSGADRSSDAERNGGAPRRKQLQHTDPMDWFGNQQVSQEMYLSDSDIETRDDSRLKLRGFKNLGGYGKIKAPRKKSKPEGSGSSAAETSGDTTVHEGQIEGSSGEETES